MNIDVKHTDIYNRGLAELILFIMAFGPTLSILITIIGMDIFIRKKLSTELSPMMTKYFENIKRILIYSGMVYLIVMLIKIIIPFIFPSLNKTLILCIRELPNIIGLFMAFSAIYYYIRFEKERKTHHKNTII